MIDLLSDLFPCMYKDIQNSHHKIALFLYFSRIYREKPLTFLYMYMQVFFTSQDQSLLNGFASSL